jgi:hypothetical protein
MVGILLIGAVPTVGGVAVSALGTRPKPTVFTIVNHGSGMCLESNGSGWGEPIVQKPSHGAPSQKWTTSIATTSHYLIHSVANPVCLDVRNGVNANRTVVQQWACRNVPSMRWRFTTLIPEVYFKVDSTIGPRCLDVAGGSLQSGARIQIYQCTRGSTNTAQLWKIE